MYSDTQVQNIDNTAVARESVGTLCTQIHRYKTLTILEWPGTLWVHSVLRHRYKTLTTLQWLGYLIVHCLLKHMHMIDTAAARGSVGTLCTQTHRCKRSTILQWLGTLWVHCVLCGYTVYSNRYKTSTPLLWLGTLYTLCTQTQEYKTLA